MRKIGLTGFWAKAGKFRDLDIDLVIPFFLWVFKNFYFFTWSRRHFHFPFKIHGKRQIFLKFTVENRFQNLNHDIHQFFGNDDDFFNGFLTDKFLHIFIGKGGGFNIGFLRIRI